jgi:hypothetical protein
MFDRTHDAGGNQMLVGGRLFNESDIRAHGDKIVDAMRTVVEGGATFGGHILNPGFGNPDVIAVDNPVNPAWRTAAAADVFMLPVPATNTLAERMALEDRVTNVFGKALREASPNSTSYVNAVCPCSALRWWCSLASILKIERLLTYELLNL